MSELELCSPFVFGQSRQEFMAHLALGKPATVDGFYDDQKDTVVNFSIEGRLYGPPKVKMPFFPLVRDSLSRTYFKSSKTALASPIVHELCALRMSQARTDRARYGWLSCVCCYI